MSDNVKPVRTNLIRQNCFVRDVTTHSCNVVSYDERYEGLTYDSIDQVTRDDGLGVDLKFSTNTYPINPQYVQSFVDAADYHNDPLSAIANAPARQNLKDVRDYQSVQDMDTSEQLKLFEQLKAALGKVSTPQGASSTPQGASSTPQGD